MTRIFIHGFDWNEKDHPRNDSGEFAGGSGGSSIGSKAPPPKNRDEREHDRQETWQSGKGGKVHTQATVSGRGAAREEISRFIDANRHDFQGKGDLGRGMSKEDVERLKDDLADEAVKKGKVSIGAIGKKGEDLRHEVTHSGGDPKAEASARLAAAEQAMAAATEKRESAEKALAEHVGAKTIEAGSQEEADKALVTAMARAGAQKKLKVKTGVEGMKQRAEFARELKEKGEITIGNTTIRLAKDSAPLIGGRRLVIHR